ncbi:MAG: hypothetical protein A2314_07325 [Elusimicrobia bacterium RIFOXYB2_FULL_50_12]|nr:MAG: hypothetical protein A2314_07325 [Elusimicrobia bacterium RIFOXYB2_FULL_50_12]
MQEKVRLLMEETGCEQGEAELALELTGHDLEKAIRTIESLLRHIYALKGKFYFPEKNLYGLLLVVINTKTENILRLRTVVSYNPSLYENAPEMDWYALEKLIFSCRLDEGSIPEYTQDVEQRISDYLGQCREPLFKADAALFADIMNRFFAPDKIVSRFAVEELNLAQFRHLPAKQTVPAAAAADETAESGTVWLQVALIEDKSGKDARRLEEGEVILSEIVDTRDIAHYLAHLIGSRRGESMVPLPAVIRKIDVDKHECEIQVHYAPGIVGIARVSNDFRVKVVETVTAPWWKKILPWNS